MAKDSGQKQDAFPAKEPSFGRESFRWLGYGIELIGVMAIFAYGGWRLDKHCGTRPWLMVALMLVAFVGMMYLLYKDTAQWRK